MPLFTPGFANPMTTGGDVIYGGASGAATRLGNGVSGQVLTSSGGTSAPTWAVPAPFYKFTSQSTTLNPAVLGTYYLLSGSSFVITLPTAASVSGQGVYFQHNGTSMSQFYTLNTTSAQTIGGVASGSYILYTNGEVLGLISDGTNWQIVSHKTESAWVAYTPTLTGFGTPSAVSFFSRRNGPDLKVSGIFTAGTTTGTQARFSIGYDGVDSTVSVNSAASPGVIGPAVVGAANATTFGWYILSPSSNQAYVNMSVQTNTLNGTSAQNASTAVGNGQIVSVLFSVPIAGWQP